MSLSRRDARVLAEIEQMLRRQDRTFARRIDELNAVWPSYGGHRFACPLSRREMTYVIVATLFLALIPALLTVTLADPPCRRATVPTVSPASPMLPAPPQRPGCPP